MNHKEPDAAEQYNDGNERDIEQKQQEPASTNEAVENDDEIDSSAIRTLPGTGGPDDVGDIDLAPEDYNRSGHPDE